MAIVWLVLPVIGLLEHAGLKERARAVVAGLRRATSSRILLAYFAIRQITAALGLTSLGGHAQMVRPLIAPMAEGAAENQYGELPKSTRTEFERTPPRSTTSLSSSEKTYSSRSDRFY